MGSRGVRLYRGLEVYLKYRSSKLSETVKESSMPKPIMTGLSTVVDYIKPSQAYFYHLIVLDSWNNRIQIVPYGRNSFAQAVQDYSAYEKRAAEGEKIEPVLVSAGVLDQVRSAYPNFFLDIRAFIKLLTHIDLNYLAEVAN